MSKKRISYTMNLILSLCFLTLFFSLSEAEVTLTIEDGSGLIGSSDNQVAVSLENQNDKVKGVQIDVCDVDDYLACTGCETTERASAFVCEINEKGNGCCGVILISTGDSIVEGTGPIFTLIYDVSGEAPAEECRNLDPEEVKVSGENQQPLDVTSESGEFCFLKSEASIDILTDPLGKSRWIPLPYLMIIEGEGTHFKFFKTKLDFEPKGVVLPFWPLIWSDLYIWDLIWVMPVWLAGREDQDVTVTVTTEDEVVESDFEISLLPFILDQERILN